MWKILFIVYMTQGASQGAPATTSQVIGDYDNLSTCEAVRTQIIKQLPNQSELFGAYSSYHGVSMKTFSICYQSKDQVKVDNGKANK